MNAQRDESENLPAALNHYRRALAGLLDPTPDHPSGRYAALVDAIPGRQGSGGHHARSMPPAWIDAIQLAAQIDAQALKWFRKHWDANHDRKSVPGAPGRLENLSALNWRPQDAELINDYANTITRWALDIDTLTLSATLHKWELAVPCPACGTATTHRIDSAGDHVRQAALQITANGCVCTHCRTTWAPEYFAILARVLGCDQPLGVLE